MRAPAGITIGYLISRELSRRITRRIRSGPLYRWRFSGSTPERLTMAPSNLRPSDPGLALDFYSGCFTFGGLTVTTHGASPFQMEPPSSEWYETLHRFRWLRHLDAAQSDLARASAAAFVVDWIDQCGNTLDGDCWRSDLTATRLISWFIHAPMMASNTGSSNYHKFLKSIARQSRYLHHNVPSVRDGLPRLQTVIALAYASLCIEGWDRQIRTAERELERELARQILPDGGHISRNPIVLVELLADLLPLQQAYKTARNTAPPHLDEAIERLMIATRFFRHSNGMLAQFNGTGQTPAALLATVLRYDDAKSTRITSAPYCGYERLESNKTTIIMDTGKPISRKSARDAMAGTLSFELSSGATRFIANCGLPEFDRQRFLPFARATAAHSTITVSETSSSRFTGENRVLNLLPSPLVHAPNNVNVERWESDGFTCVKACHDGYVQQFGLMHEREIHLSEDGRVVNGIDRLIANKTMSTHAVPFAIRFHLPSSVNASPLSSGYSILLAGQDNDAWTFTCVDAAISLEESIQFSGPGHPRRSQQILITSAASSSVEIRWMLERQKAKRGRKSKTNTSKGKTPVDLLDLMDPSDLARET